MRPAWQVVLLGHAGHSYSPPLFEKIRLDFQIASLLVFALFIILHSLFSIHQEAGQAAACSFGFFRLLLKV